MDKKLLNKVNNALSRYEQLLTDKIVAIQNNMSSTLADDRYQRNLESERTQLYELFKEITTYEQTTNIRNSNA